MTRRLNINDFVRRMGRVLMLLLSVAAYSSPVNAGLLRGADGSGLTSVEKVSVAGISNFGAVDARLYRGAQPQPGAFGELQRLGVDTVVRFNADGYPVAAEKSKVESLGMKFVSIPWSGRGEPTHDQVIAFLTLLYGNPDAKIFVHCRMGADRTGVMVALYRLTFSHWDAGQATHEMKEYHYHHTLLPHLQRYVEAFAAAMAADKRLQLFDNPLALASH